MQRAKVTCETRYSWLGLARARFVSAIRSAKENLIIDSEQRFSNGIQSAVRKLFRSLHCFAGESERFNYSLFENVKRATEKRFAADENYIHFPSYVVVAGASRAVHAVSAKWSISPLSFSSFVWFRLPSKIGELSQSLDAIFGSNRDEKCRKKMLDDDESALDENEEVSD